MQSTRQSLATTLFLVLTAAVPSAAQSPPVLVPVPVADAAAVLSFNVDNFSNVVVQTSGCVAMFDTDAMQAVCMDPATGATRRFGRSGSGPGEFLGPGVMAPMPNGGLLVFDAYKNMRFTVITPDWKLGRIIPERQGYHGLYRSTSDSVIALGGGARGWDVVAISLRDGGVVPRFSPAAADSSNIFQGPENNDYGLFLTARQARGWYVSAPWAYQILVEDDHGTRLSSFGRALPPELPSASEVAEMRERTQKMNPGLKIDGLVNRWAKDPKPAIAMAPVEDGAGRLWVVTGRIRDDSTEVDVFDAHQHFLGTRRVPGIARGITAHGNDLYLIAEHIGGDADGEYGLLHYRIR